MRKLYLLTFIALCYAFHLEASTDIHVIQVTLYSDQNKQDTVKVGNCINSGTTIYVEVKVKNEGTANYNGGIYLYYTAHLNSSPEYNPPKWFRPLGYIDHIQVDTGSIASITVPLTVKYNDGNGGGFPPGLNIIIVWPTGAIISTDSSFSNHSTSALTMCANTTGINNDPNKSLFNIYPNPSKGKVFITLS